jgi:valyl-tRNA synthetase
VGGLEAYSWDEYADWYIEISKGRISGGDEKAAKQVSEGAKE